MARTKRQGFPSEIQAILNAAKEADPEKAIRKLAQRLLGDYQSLFPDHAPPHNMQALASFRSIRITEDQPIFSKDAELAPDGRGGVIMRINQDRPKTRQRFSIGHEIGHTFFPGYESEVHCRKGRQRDWSDPNDLIEYLCDVAASELLFPEPWFHDDVGGIAGRAAELMALAQKYEASPDATIRRFVEVRDDPQAAVFFRWKLKPTERRRADAKNQRYIFGSKSAFEPPRKLRVEYSVTNEAFEKLGHHIPAAKSVADDSVISRVAAIADCLDATEILDLGAFKGRFDIHAFPIYTADDDIGPNGERSVAAVISPAKSPVKRKRTRPR